MEDDISITKTVEMKAMLIGTTKVFEVGFMLQPCLFTPLRSNDKQESVLLKEKL